MRLTVDRFGQVHAVYDETLDLAAFGRLTITRAGRVEPTPDGRWRADLSPVGGGALGPFDRRSEALAAEAAWLDEHWLAPGP